MALACARSLRAVGHTEDIVVLTYDPDLRLEGLDVRCFPEVNHPALDLHHIKSRRLVNLCDIGKVHYWALEEYDKVIALDPDIMFYKKINEWHRPSLTGLKNSWGGPLCSCFMVLEPNCYSHMWDTLMNSTFTYDEGWDKVGEIDWRFQAANAGQGFLYYYFKMLKKSFHYFKFKKYGIEWFHYGGELKCSPKYQAEISGLIPLQ